MVSTETSAPEGNTPRAEPAIRGLSPESRVRFDEISPARRCPAPPWEGRARAAPHHRRDWTRAVWAATAGGVAWGGRGPDCPRARRRGARGDPGTEPPARPAA